MSQDLLHVMDVGRQPYRPVLALQERLAAERLAGTTPDTLVLVEHDPVYTLGRRSIPEHIVASEAHLKRLGIEVVETARGGDVTYHGPGQLVGYPILHLGNRGGAVWYVGCIEQVIIAALAEFGISAGTDPINRGVWVGREKIAAIGVRISRQVTQHGFALNVCPDMSHYAGIVPCGIKDRGVTSMHLQGKPATMADVKQAICRAFQQVFAYAALRTVESPLAAAPTRTGSP